MTNTIGRVNFPMEVRELAIASGPGRHRFCMNSSTETKVRHPRLLRHSQTHLRCGLQLLLSPEQLPSRAFRRPLRSS
jgi:hypothetical protein